MDIEIHHLIKWLGKVFNGKEIIILHSQTIYMGTFFSSINIVLSSSNAKYSWLPKYGIIKISGCKRFKFIQVRQFEGHISTV